MSKRNPSKARQRARQKSSAPGMGIWIIGAVVLVAIAAVLILIAQGNPATATGSFITPETREWPMEEGKALGAADAPVVIREFSDFQCPFCRNFSNGTQKQIIDQYIETGQVRFEYHHFIVIDGNVGGNESRRAAEASECAAEQNAFWDYHEILFANQIGEGVGGYNDARLRQFAQALGLNTEQFNQCFNSGKYASAVSADEAMARSLRVTGTPSVFVNDTKIENPMDLAAIQAAIQAELVTNQ